MTKIIKAQLEHLDDVLSLEKLCFSNPWTEGQLLSEIESEYGCIFVKYDGDAPIGYCIYHMAGDQAELYRIGTDPDKRGQGIGDDLMKEGVSWAKGQCAESIFLEVRASNIPAISLYEKHGFENIGMRKKYYTDPIEDAVIMVRKVTEDDNSCS
ncbi:MAG: ribosomal protein S18-alanine N-acetyltransferase [Oscillospiraceae bacterium]|nr:ribosomal protein S18-alanine N-acetyltransferase [Oscillospiraceae bacterium]